MRRGAALTESDGTLWPLCAIGACIALGLGLLGPGAIDEGVSRPMREAAGEIIRWTGFALGAAFAWKAWLLLQIRQKRSRLINFVRDQNDLLKLSWQDFEVVLAEGFRSQGWRVQETGGGGADGGVDLRMSRGRQKALVQAKRWQARAGVKEARELYGIMCHEKADMGVLCAAGGFTKEARAFAAEKNLRLLGPSALMKLLERAKGKKPTP